MKLNLSDKVKAAVEVNGELLVASDDSLIFESINETEAYFLIKSVDEKTIIKIKFIKKEDTVQAVDDFINNE